MFQMKHRNDSYLFTEPIIPQKAKFPVIDAHNHLWGAWYKVRDIVRIMKTCGVAMYADLTANVELKWVKGGYNFQESDISRFFNNVISRYPLSFYGFTTATFTRPTTRPLFDNAQQFVEETIKTLHEHIKIGAKGLKILKELGIRYKDKHGKLIKCSDERLAPIWEECAKLKIPVLLHQADPYGFFQPLKEGNEHLSSLHKYPSWSFAKSGFPKFEQLLYNMVELVQKHRNTIFILAHVANFPENLKWVGSLLDNNPNVYIDISARTEELGRQPYTARKFFLQYQDRIIFGTDMPPSIEMYRYYFRFLETNDEYFIHPDYDGTFSRYRWRIYGINLPDNVLRKIYYANILKLIPSLKASYYNATTK